MSKSKGPMAIDSEYNEKKWKAESDYRALTEAAEIIDDTARYNAAIKAGDEKMKEMEKLKKSVNGLRKRD